MFELIRVNRNKSIALVGVIALLLLCVGYVGGEIVAPGIGLGGLGIAGLIWIVMSLVAFYGGRNVLLALSGARKIEKKDHPRLWNVVEEMTIASGMAKPPDVYIINDPSPNAFATGRDPEHSAVAVTSGLLKILNRDELQGVVAHEMGHIQNRDVLFMTMVSVMVGTVAILADVYVRVLFYGGGRRSRTSSGGGQAQAVLMIVGLLFMILAPIAAQIIYFAVSRGREYLADAQAAVYTRYPEGLASALEKLLGVHPRLERASRATAPMYIVSPLAAKGSEKSLMSTHPPTMQRIQILRGMGGAGLGAYDQAWSRVTRKTGHVVPAQSLQSSPEVAARDASAETGDRRTQARATDNFLWQTQGFLFLTCACGTKFKAPPNFPKPFFPCPRCKKQVEVRT